MRPAIQIWSNFPLAPTGYGQQTRVLADWLTAEGFEVSISSNYGVQAAVQPYTTSSGKVIPQYPMGYDGYSQDVIVSHANHWAEQTGRQTVLLTLFDTWVLKNDRLAELPAIVSWVPIDHTPVPPAVARWCGQPNVTPVAMAEFGKQQLDNAGVQSVFIPHTVSEEFSRRPGGGELMGFCDDQFVVMMNAANKGTAPTRKAWSENFLALSMFMAKHDDVVAYIHTEARCPAGIDLTMLAKAAGIPKGRLVFPDQYAYRIGMFSNEMLAKMYSRANVMLAVSLGEGFGIPTVEAQACGTRVIGANATATPELVSKDSWLVDGQPEWDPAQLSFWFRPHIHPMVNALEEAYQAKRGQSPQAISKADQYREKHWLPKWGELLEKVL